MIANYYYFDLDTYDLTLMCFYTTSPYLLMVIQQLFYVLVENKGVSGLNPIYELT